MKVDPHEAIDFIYRNSTVYAKAKAEVTYLEEFRKSKKAILFSQAIGNTVADRENQAYAHPEYQALLKGLQAAVEVAEELRWKLTAAQARIDVWRSQEASNRAMDRNTQ
jgi:phosphorylcholine metabolism protein LicD